MTAYELSPEAEAQRAIFKESDWAAIVGSLGVELPEAAKPLQDRGSDDAEVHADLEVAVSLVADAPLRFTVLSGFAGKGGFYGSLGTDGVNASCAVRRIVPGKTEGELGLVPEVEVSVFAPGVLAVEIVRLLFPPDEDWTGHEQEVLVSAAVGGRLTEAAGNHDAVAALVETESVLGDPEVVTSLAQLQGDATIVLEEPDQPASALRILLGTRGWVEVIARGDLVQHRPLSLEQLRERLHDTFLAAAMRLASVSR